MKTAEFAPPFTVTEAGVCNAVLDADNATVTPATGAAAASATLHVMVAFWPNVSGLQERTEIGGDATRFMVVVID